MPDGSALLADHYFARSKESLPTILIRSPWGRGWEAPPFSLVHLVIGERFAARGYHVVVQSTRGQADNELVPDRAGDGPATLEWLGRQSWFNGCLGMWGASVLGYMQWAAAVDAPPFLQALVPITTTSDWTAFFYQDDALMLDRILRVLFLTRGLDLPLNKMMQRMRNQDHLLAEVSVHLPLDEANRVLVGEAVTSWRDTLAHPDRADVYWRALDHCASVSQVRAATHLISGWYDVFLRELLADYAALEAAGRAPYLTIGPWHHLSDEFGNASQREGLAGFEAQLKGDRARLRAKPVRIYVMGAEEWREFDHFPPPTRETRWFLHSGGILSSEEPEANAAPDHYRYDPADPPPAVGGALMNARAGAQDNRTLEARSDVLCYTTPPLEADLEVIGTPRLALVVCSSVEHTDFFGRVCDVYPDGRSLNVCDGLFRVRPGKGLRRADGSVRLEIALYPTAYRFGRGHRLRLQVSSGAHPRWNRNLNTGEPISTGERMLVAEQTIYHDAWHPSALVLPTLERGMP
jgi:uncharacterized protein